MASLNSNNLIDIDDPIAENKQSPVVKIVSILTAVLITAGLLIGFLVWRKKHAEQVTSEQLSQTKPVHPALPAKVQVFMDEAVRKGPQVIISGTVQNISDEKLSDLVVDVELAHRKDGNSEIQSLNVEPRELGPSENGKYNLTLTGDFRSIKILHIKSGAGTEELGFKTSPGAKRPPEHPPETKSIVVDRPSAPKQGEEFINTPDNPSRIP